MPRRALKRRIHTREMSISPQSHTARKMSVRMRMPGLKASCYPAFPSQSHTRMRHTAQNCSLPQ